MNRVGAAILGMIALAGCTAGQPAQTGGDAEFRVALVFDEGGRGDKSFNDSAARGLERIPSELGGKIQEVDSKSQADYKTNFEQLSIDKPDLIIGVGSTMEKAMFEAADSHPEQKYAIIDVPSDKPNLLGYTFREEEGSFLVGVLAGLTSKTGKVGFVGGKSIDLIKKFEAGFRAGVKAARPEAQVVSKYTEDWFDVAKGKEAALAVYASGADIVYHASGKCGLGVINAAEERGLLAIGVDSDQDDLAPGHVLTSMIKRVDLAVLDAAKRAKSGNFKGGTVVLGLKEGGVGITEMRHTKHLLPPRALEIVRAYESMIKNGTLRVPTTLEEVEKFVPPPVQTG
ncbi:BMP family ABC transporter substrate-binding protein [Fimbriimonadia bacterium ATM]|nr:MAG: BMP family ABC transporter substrate-binding protein [Armatimonadota bacterium]MBC6970740.1 BMP family ABC transporter substrate-binding protein [Armatimonadota bacterium]MCE7900214.1 BMP family ABC transporter substrate-binding protein [Armatimonadetes bacterium ATM1]MDL1928828.1 BMP family ABC transporter substrate-binding protein [Fimbriimonadia bacterium ATM]RIJ96695.1 MAG: BMP family ABC transporter substrate-binding protein [Armatimonadota bacterium]